MEFADYEELDTKKVLDDYSPNWDGNPRTRVAKVLRSLLQKKVLEIAPGSLKYNFEKGHKEESNLTFLDRNEGFYLWYYSSIESDLRFLGSRAPRHFGETLIAEVPKIRGVSRRVLERYADKFRKTYFPWLGKPI